MAIDTVKGSGEIKRLRAEVDSLKSEVERISDAVVKITAAIDDLKSSLIANYKSPNVDEKLAQSPAEVKVASSGAMLLGRLEVVEDNTFKVLEGQVRVKSKIRVFRGEVNIFEGVISGISNNGKNATAAFRGNECSLSFNSNFIPSLLKSDVVYVYEPDTDLPGVKTQKTIGHAEVISIDSDMIKIKDALRFRNFKIRIFHCHDKSVEYARITEIQHEHWYDTYHDPGYAKIRTDGGYFVEGDIIEAYEEFDADGTPIDPVEKIIGRAEITETRSNKISVRLLEGTFFSNSEIRIAQNGDFRYEKIYSITKPYGSGEYNQVSYRSGGDNDWYFKISGWNFEVGNIIEALED